MESSVLNSYFVSTADVSHVALNHWPSLPLPLPSSLLPSLFLPLFDSLLLSSTVLSHFSVQVQCDVHSVVRDTFVFINMLF